MTAHWKSDFAVRVPALAALNAAALELRTAEWPTCGDLNRVLERRAGRIVNSSGLPLKFIPQASRSREFAGKYEPRIYLRGEVQFRAGDWHDVFNALAWLTFPRAKAALNRRHFLALEGQRTGGAGNRSPLQDALTLLDESGVLVVADDAGLGELMASHAWKQLFWHRRADVLRRMRFYPFGHGLGEKMLRPFIGVTGRGLICKMPGSFMTLPMADQLEALDAQIAARIGDEQSPLATHDLTPVPLLGIPGWCAASDDERYYDNAVYFRPRRGATPGRR